MAVTSFYVTGGTIRPNARCYVERQADRDLFQALLNGEFCYILTARQMGKSSLMVRVASRLRAEGAFIAVLDLTASGRNVTPGQWYNGLLRRLGQQLKLEDEIEEFWEGAGELGPLQRWTEALRRVSLPVLQQRHEASGSKEPLRLFIFIDEIDVVRSLPFSTDEFFAAIREVYNRRAVEPEVAALSFCLLGVASPQDLIADTRITPFNIGRRIELRDFTLEEALPLAAGLAPLLAPERAGETVDAEKSQRFATGLLKRVMYWTGGHPYLTQRFCATLVERQDGSSGSNIFHAIDALCHELFLTRKALDSDDNLVYVRERILNSGADKNALLDLYHDILQRKEVLDSETNVLTGQLRLAGITRSVNGRLEVRNRIYETAFNRDWALSNMSSGEAQRQRVAYKRGYRRGLVRALACTALGLVLLLAGFIVEEHVRGAVTLSRWMKQQRVAGEKFTVLELAGPSFAIEDLGATYQAAARLTNLVACADNFPRITLPDGRSLCWAHLKEQTDLWRDALDELHNSLAAVRKTKPWLFDRPDFDNVPNFVRIRGAAQRMAAAARSHAHEGDMDAALRDLTDLARIARPLQEHIGLVELMIGVAVRGLAVYAVGETFNSPNWTDHALRDLAEAYQPWIRATTLQNVLKMDRAVGIGTFEVIRKSNYEQVQSRFKAMPISSGSAANPKSSMDRLQEFIRKRLFPVWKFAWLDQAELAYLKTMEAMIDLTRQLPGPGDHFEGGGWNQFEKQCAGSIETIPNASFVSRALDPLFSQSGVGSAQALIPNCVKVCSTLLKNEVYGDLALVGIAIRRYQIANHKLPEKLDDLAPQYIAALPPDRFSGKPLHYRVTVDPSFDPPQQTWILYSVGHDGQDDGGSKERFEGVERDIVFLQPSST